MKNAIVTITKININPTASIVNQVSTPPKPGAIQFAIDSAVKKQHMETIIHIARYFKTKGVILFMSLFFASNYWRLRMVLQSLVRMRFFCAVFPL